MGQINNEFNIDETLSLFTKMIHNEIKWYQEKILKPCKKNEIAVYESKIKNLQKELYEVRFNFIKQGGKIKLPLRIALNKK